MYDDILSGKASKPKGKSIIPKPEKFRKEKEFISLYTQSEHFAVNKYLRTGELDYKEALESIDKISKELESLPDFKGPVYRGVKNVDPKTFVKILKLKPGTIVKEE
jgi:hypothetical protein